MTKKNMEQLDYSVKQEGDESDGNTAVDAMRKQMFNEDGEIDDGARQKHRGNQ